MHRLASRVPSSWAWGRAWELKLCNSVLLECSACTALEWYRRLHRDGFQQLGKQAKGQGGENCELDILQLHIFNCDAKENMVFRRIKPVCVCRSESEASGMVGLLGNVVE